MSSTSKTLLSWWDRVKLYFPFRKNFILFLGFGLLLISERNDLLESMDENSIFLRKNVVDFLISFFFQVWIVMVLLGLMTCFLAFYYNMRSIRQKGNFQILENYDQHTLRTILSVDLEGLMRPYLGSLGLIFGIDEVYSPLQYFRKLGAQKYHLDYAMDMPFVKRYHFNQTFLVHYDIFGFFRIVLPKAISEKYTQRAQRQDIELSFPPHSLAHDEELESDQIQRVKGEWLHYKTFEPSDDVRRIIWRVYAQNRELVIRQQENFSPYTSTVSFYTSFLNADKMLYNNPWISDYYLTRYKNACWTIYYSLKKKGALDVKYIPDQKMAGLEAESPLEHDHEIMSISEWIQSPKLTEYISERDAYILCISPLIDLEDLQDLIAYNSKVEIYIVLPSLVSSRISNKKLDIKRLIYRQTVGIEERNLRFYNFMGQQKIYRKKVQQVLNTLENLGVMYTKVEV